MYKDKKILVIGGTGTIGSSLVKKLIDKEAKVIRILSRDEYKQYKMMQEYKGVKNLRFLLGDIRDYERLNRAMEDIDIVFHMAALKHVPSCEYNPFEAVKTNVLGTQNIIEAAINNDVERVLFTSSDKTISPTNTYGATKLLAERLISSADYYKGSHRTIFAAVRFGNVMGSRGSVIPLFKNQILDNKEITVTDSTMSRFMMTVSQATNLTLEACHKAKGGEIFVLKMPVINLKDLAEVVMQEVTNKYKINPKEVKIKEIGLRPGEKMYEELMTIEESIYAIELDNMFAISPILQQKEYKYDKGIKANVNNYSSNDIESITKDSLRQLIIQEKLL
jgi:FlaA1/EpsC-like NDP-sugar epimerase